MTTPTVRPTARRAAFHPLRVASVEPLCDDAAAVTFDVPVELGPILVRFQPFAETIRAPEPRYFASGAR